MKINKILLIHSSHYDEDGNVVRSTGILGKITVANVVHSALPLLAAYLPKDIEAKLIEDCFESINYDENCEVVAISAQVMQFKRACDIASEFQKRGKIVLMGGYLPTMHPKQVLPFVDSICIGEGDSIFPKMIDDIQNNKLQKIYEDDSLFDITKIPTPRYDLIKKDRFVVYPVTATRGCPYKCSYCSITQFFKHTYRKRPIDQVIRDIKASNSKSIYFTDDNLMEDFDYSKELFKKLAPLNITWGTQTTINVAKDSELLKLAYVSGCRFLAIGIETLNNLELDNINKSFNNSVETKKAISEIHKSGISVHALIIIGLDSDTHASIFETISFLNDQSIAISEFFLCTPYPETPMGKKYINDCRIIDTDLSHYRESFQVINHPNFSDHELPIILWKTLRKYYNLKDIISRILKGKYKNKCYHLVNAIFYWIKIKRNIHPVYFGPGNKASK